MLKNIIPLTCLLRDYLPSKIQLSINHIAFLFLFILVSSCDVLEPDPEVVTFEYDFTQADHNWEVFYSDYTDPEINQAELQTDYTSLPAGLTETGNAHFASVLNHPENFKILYRLRVDNLAPFAPYEVRYTIRFATNVPSGCGDIGEPAGEDQYVLARSHVVKPDTTNILQLGPTALLNIQYFDNPQNWLENSITDDITNSRSCNEPRQFEIKEIRTKSDHNSVTADSNGRMWLIFGTHSDFPGDTSVYFTYFKAEFRQIS